MKSKNRDAKLIFGEALRLSVPAEREAYPDRTCAGNQPLGQEKIIKLGMDTKEVLARFKAERQVLPAAPGSLSDLR